MSEINYQALREAAERAIPAMERLLMLPADDDLLSEQELKDYGVDIDALNAFKFLAGPETVLALLDERERNQQYIKRRDQENEEIALTVGKLRVELEAANKRIAELEAEPVSQAYNLAELIEGMEVSIDVSTCDADLGNRYFGTVTEALELDTAKNGYILLVQDAEPNFDVNGNYPVTPDGWISCSERMPNDAQWCVVNTKYGYYVQCWSEGQGWLGDDISIPECDVINWMPLPEPPQEVNRG
ncbi:ead/Ea22-like family protein [Escherichia coli]|nr:ead/Ea22-like family protein [Escherichia coli]MCV8222228.1 ead/Ea22-like family protein [Escherichia coli]